MLRLFIFQVGWTIKIQHGVYDEEKGENQSTQKYVLLKWFFSYFKRHIFQTLCYKLILKCCCYFTLT